MVDKTCVRSVVDDVASFSVVHVVVHGHRDLLQTVTLRQGVRCARRGVSLRVWYCRAADRFHWINLDFRSVRYVLRTSTS